MLHFHHHYHYCHVSRNPSFHAAKAERKDIAFKSILVHCFAHVRNDVDTTINATKTENQLMTFHNLKLFIPHIQTLPPAPSPHLCIFTLAFESVRFPRPSISARSCYRSRLRVTFILFCPRPLVTTAGVAHRGCVCVCAS